MFEYQRGATLEFERGVFGFGEIVLALPEQLVGVCMCIA